MMSMSWCDNARWLACLPRLYAIHPLRLIATSWLLATTTIVMPQSARHADFEDRPTLFKMRQLSSMEERGFDRHPFVYWRTDQELVVNSYRYKDRRGSGAWDQGTYVWNIDTDTITQTPYLGRISCLSPHRIVLRRDVPNPDPAGKKIQIEYWGAIFGQYAARIESGVYNEFSCDPMTRRVSRDYGESTSLVPLNPGDGSVLLGTMPVFRDAWFVPADGVGRKRIGAGVTANYGEKVSFDRRYLPWLKSYLFIGATGDHSIERMWTYDIALYFLSPDGTIERQAEPVQINKWKKDPDGPGTPTYTVTRAGTIAGLRGRIAGRPQELMGLYVERDGRLIRFLRNGRITQIHVSPNGCRGLADVDPTGTGFPVGTPTERYLIEFCDEGKS